MQCESLTWVAGTHVLGPSPAASQGVHQQDAGTESRAVWRRVRFLSGHTVPPRDPLNDKEQQSPLLTSPSPPFGETPHALFLSVSGFWLQVAPVSALVILAGKRMTNSFRASAFLISLTEDFLPPHHPSLSGF